MNEQMNKLTSHRPGQPWVAIDPVRCRRVAAALAPEAEQADL